MGFPLSVIPIKILSGTSLSSTAAYIGDGILAGIIMPATWTTANLTFQGGAILDETVFPAPAPAFNNLFDAAGNEVTVDAAASIQITLPDCTDGSMYGCQFIKVRSGTSGSAVNQSADRQLYLIVQKRHSTNTR